MSNRPTRNEKPVSELHVQFAHAQYGEPGLLPRPEGEKASYRTVYLVLELSVGDISDPPFSNSFVYPHHYTCYKTVDRVIAERKEALLAMDAATPVYLWLREGDGNGYLNLLKHAELFKHFREVYLIRCYTEADREREDYRENDSFERKERLSAEELDAMSARFREIALLGGTYRAGKYGEVKVLSEAYLEELVLGQLPDAYADSGIGFGSLYLGVREAVERDTGYIILFETVEEVVWQLLIKRRIGSSGSCAWWAGGEYRAALFEQSFCLQTPYPVSYTYSGMLALVRDAFEFGDTCPLYWILAEDAVLEFEDEHGCFRGRRKIVEFIEEEGVRHVHSRKEKIFCDVCRVDEGERYGVGDLCLLLGYEDRNGRSWHYVVKLHEKDGRITRLRLFNAIGPLKLSVANE